MGAQRGDQTGAKGKGKGKNAGPATYIREDGDEPMDLLDRTLAGRVGSEFIFIPPSFVPRLHAKRPLTSRLFCFTRARPQRRFSSSSTGTGGLQVQARRRLRSNAHQRRLGRRGRCWRGANGGGPGWTSVPGAAHEYGGYEEGSGRTGDLQQGYQARKGERGGRRHHGEFYVPSSSLEEIGIRWSVL
jgi:hypothetical protein